LNGSNPFGPREIGDNAPAIGDDRTMRGVVLGCVVGGVMSSSALAQPGATEPAPPSESPATLEPAREAPMAEKLLQSARSAARDGRCDTISIIGARVRAIDPNYYATVFAGDPQIASCRQGMPFRPPSSAAAIASTPAPSVDQELLPSEIVEVKSPGTALALSLGVTAGGVALAYLAEDLDHDGNGNADALGTLGSIAFFVGPTVGHIYAGNTWNTGLKWRLAGLGVSFGGLVFAFSQCGIFEGCSQSEQDAADVGAAIAIGGVIMYVGGTIYEIATAGRSAREFNLDYSRRRLQLQIAPMPGRAPGLALAGSF
jgi:hypothetical protein